MIVKPPPRVRTITPSRSRTRGTGTGGGRSNKERQRLQLIASVARAPLCEVHFKQGNIAIWHETLMEQWIGSVHSKMAWQTHFLFFGVYRVLEKSSSYTHRMYIQILQKFWNLNLRNDHTTFLTCFNFDSKFPLFAKKSLIFNNWKINAINKCLI